MSDKPVCSRLSDEPGCSELLTCYRDIVSKYGQKAARHTLFILLMEATLPLLKYSRPVPSLAPAFLFLPTTKHRHELFKKQKYRESVVRVRSPAGARGYRDTLHSPRGTGSPQCDRG